jgi:hypothetical protein
MRRLVLQRLHRTSYATYGQLLDEENRILCVTLELPWWQNARDVSCVPPGEYPAHRSIHHSADGRTYEAFALVGVPDRDGIQIHVANLPSQLKGCIATGTHFGEIAIASGDSGYGVGESEIAFVHLMNLLAGEQTMVLTILDPPPGAA